MIFFFCFQKILGYKIKALADLVALGKIKPVIEKVYKLSEIQKAHEDLEKGGRTGKIVIEITPDLNKTTLQ